MKERKGCHFLYNTV